jgi:hypothetical protein
MSSGLVFAMANMPSGNGMPRKKADGEHHGELSSGDGGHKSLLQARHNFGAISILGWFNKIH